MSLDLLGQLNWLAVIVGALIYFVLGAIWFAPPVLGRPWMAAIGWDESRTRPEMNPASHVGPALLPDRRDCDGVPCPRRPRATRPRRARCSVRSSLSDMP
jgi:hypothetical protein